MITDALEIQSTCLLTEADLERRNPQGFRGLKGHLFEGGLRVLVDPAESGSLNRTAAELGITLTKLVPRSENLEDVFLRMTAGTPQQEQAA